MLLVFGGTTEGRIVCRLLDSIKEPYFYSTKTKINMEIEGTYVHGGMDMEEMRDFCGKNIIKLIIDAAHPFAQELHSSISKVSKQLNIPVLRYKRHFPEIRETNLIRLFETYQQLSDEATKSSYKKILALTGVKTIPKLEPLWKNKECYFRILNTPDSQRTYKTFGISDKYIIQADPKDSEEEIIELSKRTGAELILSKESGTSGFFQSKEKAAKALRIPLWIVKRPPLPQFEYTVDSHKKFLQTIYPIRKSLLKTKGKLRGGYTTGTCATAATKACFYALVENKFPERVKVFLPSGEPVSFWIFSGKLEGGKASCVVIKDAGDDPDVTHGKEIGCELSFSEKEGIRFEQGMGIGKVTLPGLQVPVGEPAINPVPRQMMTNMLEALMEEYGIESGLVVKPFVPEGQELAKLTFNPRVGVIGGISIIGTSGKVVPYSHEAFISTIRHQLSVAKKAGYDEIVLTSGKRSENIIQQIRPHLPEFTFIHFGNLIGESLKMAEETGIKKITLAIMFGKGIKLAEGHMDTHSKKVRFNPDFAAQLAMQCGFSQTIANKIKESVLANSIQDLIPFSRGESYYITVASLCYKNCREILSEKVDLSFVLLSDNGEKIICP